MLKSNFLQGTSRTFQQIVYVNFKLEEFIYSLDVMNFVYDKVTTNQPICDFLKKVIFFVYSLSIFFFSNQESWNIGDNRNLFLKLKSKLGFHHVVLTTQKLFPENLH